MDKNITATNNLTESPLVISISQMYVNGNRLELPRNVKFDNYALVKKTLVKAGGKYVKNGFAFPTDPQAIKDRLIEGEKIDDKKKFQFFATPPELAEKMVSQLDVEPMHLVLEPSAGHGALLDALKGNADLNVSPTVIEIDPEKIKILEEKGYTPIHTDFLAFDDGEFDRIIANPPFTNNQDIEHVKHMFSLLKPAGRLVAITSLSWLTGNQKKQIAFREWFNENKGWGEKLEPGVFKTSGTNVSTFLITIDKKA